MSDEEELAARLDEDEAVAKAVEDNSSPWDGQWQPRGRHALETHNGWVLAAAIPVGSDFAPGVVEHMARHDPARALRFVAAVRAIIRELNGEGHGWAEHEPSYYAGLGFAVTALAEIYDEG